MLKLYTTFGSIISEMSFSSDTSNKYRYGFNGMEKDDETSVDGGNYDFGSRIYDSRKGRWLSLDPLMRKYPDINPYNYCVDNPMFFIDADGRDIIPGTGWTGSIYEQLFNVFISQNNLQFMSIYNLYDGNKEKNLYLFYGENIHSLINGTDVEKFSTTNKGEMQAGGATKKISSNSSITSMNSNPVLKVVTKTLIGQSFEKDGEIAITYNVYGVTTLQVNQKGHALFAFHEMIHEYLNNGPNLMNENRGANNQHSLMVNDKYRTMMTTFLSDANTANNWNLNPDQITNLSYYGLKGTDEFKNFIAKREGLAENWWKDKSITIAQKTEMENKEKAGTTNYYDEMDKIIGTDTFEIKKEKAD